jgi:MFS family permease
MSTNENSKPWPNPLYSWYVVGLLVISYASGVVDRIVIGLLVTPIKADLGLSDTQIGIIQGLAFALFYSVFTLPIGYLVDRWKRTSVIWGGSFIWSCGTVAGGFANSFWALFSSRVVMGAGEATITPGSSSLIADYFPPKKRPRAYGIFAMGGSIGIGIAYLLGGIAIGLADDVKAWSPTLLGGFANWQIVFFIVGVPGLLLALVMAVSIREPERRGILAQSSGKFSLLPLWRELSTNRIALIAVMIGSIMNVMIVNAQLAWFPTLFVRVHGMEAKDIALVLAFVGVPCGILSAITAGWVLSWFAQKGRQDGPILVMGLQCLAWVVFGTAKCLAPTPELALLGHAGTSLFATWALTAALTALNQVTPNQLRGQVVSVYTLLTGLIGIAVGSGAVGVLSDYVFDFPTGIAPSLALVCFTGGMIGVVLVTLGRSSYRTAVQRAASWGEGV